MDIQKHWWWVASIIFIVGIGIGFLLGLPSDYSLDINLDDDFNETLGFYDKWFDNMTNMCCYPSDCTQAKNNPELCTCMYMVECFTTD